MAAASNPDAHARTHNHMPRAKIFHRTFECGHPDEIIEIRSLDDGEEVHNVVASETIEGPNGFAGLPTYVEARCLNCAKKAKDQDDNNPIVQPKRALSVYRSGTSFTYKRSASSIQYDAFEGALKRYRRYCDGKITKPHPPVSIEEHRAHHYEALKEAVEHPGRWLALPARRVTNIPIRTTGGVGKANFHRETSHERSETQKGLIETEIRKKELGSQISGRQSRQPHCALSASSLEIEKSEAEHAEDEQFRLTAKNMSSLSGSRISRQQKLSGSVKYITDGRDISVLNGVAKTDQVNEGPTSGRRESSTKISIDQPSDLLFDLLPGQTSYENPQPAPVVPKRGPLSFRKQRSSTTTRTSDPGSQNISKLSLDIIQSTKAFKKTELDIDSPDWACETSLAIEAGRISMDSVGMQSRRSTSSNYSSEVGPQSTEIVSTGNLIRPKTGSRIRREVQSLPSIRHSPVSAILVRHSIGVTQTARRAEATRLVGSLNGLDIAFEREPSRSHLLEVVPPIDLNKSLPALPSPESEKNDGK